MFNLLTCLEVSRPLSPTTIVKAENFATEFIIGILALLAIVGGTLLVGWVLNRMMTAKGFKEAPKLEVDGAVMDFKQAVDWLKGQ